MSVKNVLQGLVGVNAVPAQMYVDDVFSTYLYTGNGSTQTINNGISLASTTGFSSQVVSTTGSANISCSAIYGLDTYLGGYVTESTYGRPFIVKVSGGSVVWSKTIREVDFGPHEFVGTTSIKVDSTGVYVCGGTVSSSTWYTFVCKFDLSGTLLWQTYIKTNNANYTAVRSKMTIDTSNQAYIVSTADDGVGGYIQITKLGYNGAQAWSKKLDRYVPSSCNIAFDPGSSSIIVSATFSAGASGSTNDGQPNTILIKIASDGTLTWSRWLYYTLQNFDPGTTIVKNILIDSSSNIILQILATSMNSNNSQASHIIKLNSSGATVFGRAGYNSLRSASYKDYTSCLDSSDNIYVSSYNYTENGLNYIFKLNSSGTLIWSRTLDHTGRDAVIGMVISGNNLIITCYDEVKNTTEIITLDKDNPRDSATTSVGTIGLTTGNWVDSTAYGAIANYVTDGSTTYGAASAIVVGTANLTINNPVGTLSTTAAINYSAINSSGGLVWFKERDLGRDNVLQDTVRGAGNAIFSNLSVPQTSNAGGVSSYSSTGFILNGSASEVNNNNNTYASWTFRKAAKFFDIVTYTGDGTTGERAFTNPLGCTIGMVIIKPVSAAGNWIVSSIGMQALYGNGYLNLNNSNSRMTLEDSLYGQWSTFFTILHSAGNEGGVNSVNTNGVQYVAYLYAHDTSATGIIQCGSYTKNGYTHIDLGWEPQFILTKNTNVTGNWFMTDNMRGLSSNLGFTSKSLATNVTSAEFSSNFCIDSTGFRDDLTADTNRVIYMAIRRPNKPPTLGTQVYASVARTGTGAVGTSTAFGQVTDLVFTKQRSSTQTWAWTDRLRGATKELTSAANTVESTYANDVTGFDTMTGFNFGSGASGQINTSATTYVDSLFKRAPGFFDVVCYTGTGSATTFAHNLGVPPEMMIVKRRTVSNADWSIYHSTMGATKYTYLDGSTELTGSTYWNNTSPTSAVFTVGTDYHVNYAANTYVAFLFATLAGISKVGGYTGNGSSQNIDCGFVSGARFILIHRIDSGSNDWYCWDTARGILSGNDPHLSLNTTAAEVTADDSINPLNAGFTVNQASATNINVLSATYIYLAIA